MNKFNLTFNGEILAGHDADRVKLRFAEMFDIDDPARLATFFSGKTVILRRNLERKDAAQHYQELQLLGAGAALVKVTASDMADGIVSESSPKKTTKKKTKTLAKSPSKKAASLKTPAATKAPEKNSSADLPQKSSDAAADIKARKLAAQRLATEQEAETVRLAAEQAARKHAEQAEAKRLETEKIAVEEETRRRAEIEEKKRLEDAAAVRLKAELQEKQRLAAEEEAVRKAELEEKRRVAAAQEAKLKAERDTKKRLAAAKAKAEADHLLAESQRKSVQRPRKRNPKPAKNRVKTRMDVPLRRKSQEKEAGVAPQRQRLPGEPNLYTLQPFRNSEEVRARAALARKRMQQGYKLGVLALAILLIASGSFLQRREQPVTTGANAIAINSNLEPMLLAGNSLLFHDRAGVSKTITELNSMGVKKLQSPMAFGSTGVLLARGQILDDRVDDAQHETLELLRCNVSTPSCEQFSSQLADQSIEFFAVNPLDDSLLLADSAASELLKIDSSGAIVARAAIALPPQPVLRIHDGLLLVNSQEGPAISVFRYDDSAFGTQLDEVLLIPNTAQPLEHYRVGDFVWSGNAWWVNLLEPDSGLSELHRFDEEWGYLDSINLPANTGPLQLVQWGQKTLANDPSNPTIQRYNKNGASEVPFISTPLQELITEQHENARFATVVWHTALLLCALTAIAGLGFGYLQASRSLVYKMRREQGAEPLDGDTAQIRWIDPIENRDARLKRTGVYYGTAMLVMVLLATALGVTMWQMAALLLALSGPVIALVLLSRQPVGHIGTFDDKLLLVDHTGMYQLAGGSRLQYHGPFLAIDDVVVFAGTPSLPAFRAAQVKQQAMPLALGGIKVDQKILLVKLMQRHHPLALGAASIVATLAGAALLLLLQSVY